MFHQIENSSLHSPLGQYCKGFQLLPKYVDSGLFSAIAKNPNRPVLAADAFVQFCLTSYKARRLSFTELFN